MSAAVKVKRSKISNTNLGQQVDMSMLLAVVFLVMALLQLISFSAFRDWLSAAGFSATAAWAAVIVIVEVIAALGFVKLVLPPVAKMVSWISALAASGFWFYENLRLVSEGNTAHLASSGFFGKYLSQSPSWWTILEVSILLLWTLYAMQTVKE